MFGLYVLTFHTYDVRCFNKGVVIEMLLLVMVYSVLKLDCIAYWFLFATLALNTVTIYVPGFLRCAVIRVVNP